MKDGKPMKELIMKCIKGVTNLLHFNNSGTEDSAITKCKDVFAFIKARIPGDFEANLKMVIGPQFSSNYGLGASLSMGFSLEMYAPQFDLTNG